MKYKAKQSQGYKHQKPRQSFIPITSFSREESPLPEEALSYVKGAKCVATGKCDVCGNNTVKLYLRNDPVRPRFYLVCANPKCEAYGKVTVK